MCDDYTVSQDTIQTLTKPFVATVDNYFDLYSNLGPQTLAYMCKQEWIESFNESGWGKIPDIVDVKPRVGECCVLYAWAPPPDKSSPSKPGYPLLVCWKRSEGEDSRLPRGLTALAKTIKQQYGGEAKNYNLYAVQCVNGQKTNFFGINTDEEDNASAYGALLCGLHLAVKADETARKQTTGGTFKKLWARIAVFCRRSPTIVKWPFCSMQYVPSTGPENAFKAADLQEIGSLESKILGIAQFRPEEFAVAPAQYQDACKLLEDLGTYARALKTSNGADVQVPKDWHALEAYSPDERKKVVANLRDLRIYKWKACDDIGKTAERLCRCNQYRIPRHWRSRLVNMFVLVLLSVIGLCVYDQRRTIDCYYRSYREVYNCAEGIGELTTEQLSQRHVSVRLSYRGWKGLIPPILGGERRLAELALVNSKGHYLEPNGQFDDDETMRECIPVWWNFLCKEYTWNAWGELVKVDVYDRSDEKAYTGVFSGRNREIMDLVYENHGEIGGEYLNDGLGLPVDTGFEPLDVTSSSITKGIPRIRFDFDSNGYPEKINYLTSGDLPYTTGDGYCGIHVVCDDDGQIFSLEAVTVQDTAPAWYHSTSWQMWIYYNYAAEHLISKKVFKFPSDRISAGGGANKIVFLYDGHENVVEKRYEDGLGGLCDNKAGGISVEQYEYSDGNRTSVRRFHGARQTPFTDGRCQEARTYNEHGYCIERDYQNGRGVSSPIEIGVDIGKALLGASPTFRTQCTNVIHKIVKTTSEWRYLGEEYECVGTTQWGWAASERAEGAPRVIHQTTLSYDDRTSRVEIKELGFDTDYVRYSVLKRGVVEEMRIEDKKGNAVNHPGLGYAKFSTSIHKNRDDGGYELKRRYYRAESDKPALTVIFNYHRTNAVSEIQFVDAEGRLCNYSLKPGGWQFCRLKQILDNDGKTIRRAIYTSDELQKPCIVIDCEHGLPHTVWYSENQSGGYDMIRYLYGSNAVITRFYKGTLGEYYDDMYYGSEQKSQNADGYFEIEDRYFDSGKRRIESNLFKRRDGSYEKIEYEFEPNNLKQHSCHNADGSLRQDSDGVATRKFEFGRMVGSWQRHNNRVSTVPSVLLQPVYSVVTGLDSTGRVRWRVYYEGSRIKEDRLLGREMREYRKDGLTDITYWDAAGDAVTVSAADMARLDEDERMAGAEDVIALDEDGDLARSDDLERDDMATQKLMWFKRIICDGIREEQYKKDSSTEKSSVKK